MLIGEVTLNVNIKRNKIDNLPTYTYLINISVEFVFFNYLIIISNYIRSCDSAKIDRLTELTLTMISFPNAHSNYWHCLSFSLYKKKMLLSKTCARQTLEVESFVLFFLVFVIFAIYNTVIQENIKSFHLQNFLFDSATWLCYRYNYCIQYILQEYTKQKAETNFLPNYPHIKIVSFT